MARPSTTELLPRAKAFAAHAAEELVAKRPAAERPAVDDTVRLQNAAGKAWTATRMAAEAVAFCARPKRINGTKTLLRALSDIANNERRGSLEFQRFVRQVGDAHRELHIECAEQGDCAPKETARWVRTVASELVPAAEHLCRGSGSGR